MPQQGHDDDDSTGDLSEREFPDESDMDDHDSADTDPCPYCGLPIYPGAEQCTYCKRYISQEDLPTESRPKVMMVGVIVCVLVVVIVWLALGR